MSKNIDWDAVPLTYVSLALGALALVGIFIAAIIVENIHILWS